MTKLRPLNSLTEKDQGVAIVREEIRNEIINRGFFSNEPFESGFLMGLEKARGICDDCLDIATLGEIDMKGYKDEK